VHPRVTQGKGGEDVTPIFWSDNYFSLLPGEKRSVRARYDDAALGAKEPVLEVEGYNIVPGSVPVGAFSATPEN
jgi:exo-1,4-beta-D-glucosaminidase